MSRIILNRVAVLDVEQSGDRVTVRLGPARTGETSYEIDDDGAVDIPLDDLGLDLAELDDPGEIEPEETFINKDTGEVVMRFILPSGRRQ